MMLCTSVQYFFVLVFCVFETVNCGFTTTKVSPQPIWNSTHTDKLRQDLLLNYDKFARPAQHYNTTIVKFGIGLRHFELDEFKSQLTLYTWVRMVWTDEKLKWNPEDYGGIGVVHLADHEIWQPDIFLYNSARASAVGRFANTHFLVYENGEVLWVPPCQFTVLCDLNLRHWPFDTHTCTMKFGSWTYNGDILDMDFYNNSTKIDEEDVIMENPEWDIVDNEVVKNVIHYYCCPEAYTDITANITISRKSQAYNAIIITPAFAILFLMLSTFWLPPNAGEKMFLNGCVAVIICMFLLYFAQKLPIMGNHTPLIVMFYSNILLVVSWSLVGSVVVIWLSRTMHNSPLPWIIKRPLTGTLGKWLGLGIYIKQAALSHRVTAEEMRDHHVTDLDDQNSNDDHIFRMSTKPSMQQDWILLAAAIDRLSFYFYCLISLIMVVFYSL